MNGPIHIASVLDELILINRQDGGGHLGQRRALFSPTASVHHLLANTAAALLTIVLWRASVSPFLPGIELRLPLLRRGSHSIRRLRFFSVGIWTAAVSRIWSAVSGRDSDPDGPSSSSAPPWCTPPRPLPLHDLDDGSSLLYGSATCTCPRPAARKNSEPRGPRCCTETQLKGEGSFECGNKRELT